MSYAQTTPNFQLPQWVLSEPPQMNDFNTAFSNIDQKAVPNVREINTHPLSSDITLTPADISSAPWATSTTGTDNGWTFRYQKSGYCKAIVQIYKTLQSGDTPLNGQLACYLPTGLEPTNTQYLTVRAVNGSTLIDMGTAELRTDNGLYMFCKQSSTAAEYIAYGEILLAQDLGDES